MKIKCEGCKMISRYEVKRGEMCLGMNENPEPPCDIFRICFIQDGEIYRDIWISPIEVVGIRRLLNDLCDGIAESALVMMEEEADGEA